MGKLSHKIRRSLLVGLAIVNVFCMNVVLPAEPLTNSFVLGVLSGEKRRNGKVHNNSQSANRKSTCFHN